MRNRIISALSNCCIIVSAPEKSGALATAKFAEQQNKKVFIIPGTISDEKYRGSNKLLLKKNFDPALAVDDILEYLGGKKSVEQLDMFYIPAPQKNNNTDLPKEQQNLLSFFNDKPLSLEELSQKSNIDISELADILFDLELNGSVIQDIAGNYYVP
jgi:DNA processing protein